MALVTEVIEPGQPNRSFEDSIHGFPYISGLEQHLTGFECNDLTPIGQETHRVQSKRTALKTQLKGQELAAVRAKVAPNPNRTSSGVKRPS